MRRTGVLGRVDARTDAARSWARRSPTECLALALVLMVLGSDLLAVAVRTLSVVWGLIGVVVAVAGLTALHDRLRTETDRHPLRWLAIGVVVTGAGGGVIAGAFAENSAAAAALGSLVAIVGLLPVGGWLRSQGEGGHWWWAPAGLLLMALGVWRAVAGGPWWAVLVGTLLGLAAYKVGVRRACEQRRGARVVTWGGLAVTVVGAGEVLNASGGKAVLPGLVGAGLVALGLMAMSVGWPKLGRKPFTGKWAMAFGLAIVIAGGFMARGALNTAPGAAAIVAVLVAAVGGSFLWRGEALVVAVLVGTAFVWLTFDRGVGTSVDPHPDAAHRILALGDSYISGEGAPRFFDGTNVRGPAENECRRAITAYPYLLARDMGMGLDFFACSGAKAAQLYKEGQAPPRSPDKVAGELPQLQDPPADPAKVSLVLVGIGGNDAGFSTIGKGCILPGTCDELRDVWMTNLDQIGTEVAKAYDAIKAQYPTVPIVAVPYPLMLTDRACGSSRLDDKESAFISEFVVVLNDRVRVAAEKAGIYFFSDEMFAFDGARICDPSKKPTVMNFLSFNPVQGSFLERVNPKNWIHGSLHPKPAGHVRTEQALKPWLDALLAGVAAHTLPVNPPPNPTAAFTFRNVRGTTPQLVPVTKRPVDVPCLAKGEAVDPFGSRIRLIDEESPFSVVATPGAPLCFAGADGAWMATVPTATNEKARVADGAVYVPTGPKVARTTQVVFKALDGRWQLRTVEYCSNPTSRCPNPADFQNQQLGRAAQVVVPPALILLLGGWLFAVGTTRRVSTFPAGAV